MQSNQIHIDLETLDLRHTAQILSIGAVCGKESFYVEVDMAYYQVQPFTASTETIQWWEDRGGFQPSMPLVSPSNAVAQLSVWMGTVVDAEKDDWEVWANSPGFDLAILDNHFRYYGFKTPWKFYQERDVRTVKALSKQLNLGITQSKENHHNALSDALNQQEMVDRVYMTLARNYSLARDCLQGTCTGREYDGYK
jgi:hypothetical protein